MHYRGFFIGLTTIDIQYFIDEFPQQNRKIKTGAPDILVGGPATNAAVAFSYLNNGAYLLTAVGDNSFSSFIQDDFNSTKIDCTDLIAGQKVNPVVASVITSKNGDRNIFTHNPPSIISDKTPNELFKNIQPEILLCDGFYPELSIECVKLAKAKNIPVVIDGGSWKPQYDEILKYTDVAICSADFYPPECANTDDVFEYLYRKGVGKIAISRGECSILFQDGRKRGEIEIDKNRVLDTLGAGDFLHGAFTFYYLKYRSFEEALVKSSKLASVSCGYNGTREWLKY